MPFEQPHPKAELDEEQLRLEVNETASRAEIVRRRRICPHLGLRQDGTVTAVIPVDAHLCYAQTRRFSPSIEHQSIRCFSDTHPECQYYPGREEATAAGTDTERPRSQSARPKWLPWSIAMLAVLLLVAFIFVVGNRMLPYTWTIGPALQLAAAVGSTDTTPALTRTAISVLQAEAVATPIPAAAQDRPPMAPMTGAEGEVITLTPRQGDVGWWISNNPQRGFIGDSFLYAGFFDQLAYTSAVRFDLRRVQRGTPIHSATLHLTGLREDRLNQETDTLWLVQLIAEGDLPQLPGADFTTIFGAPAAIQLLPNLPASEIKAGQVNEWLFEENQKEWLFQQILDGATSVTVRISGFNVRADSLFAWDSGHGSESNRTPPELVLVLGPPPPTPPPTATRPVVVATLTPEPENVLTVVARTHVEPVEPVLQTLTTPVPIPDVITPTPLPENLATVQAAAIAEGLPPVVYHTPVPANAATATSVAAYATAVALTTGTFTPVPTHYVTPALYYPPPPPENVATAAARVLAATAVANVEGTPTPTRPWNSVPALYVFATETPANRETAVAHIAEQNFNASTIGTPTPTPWNLVVITRVPPPLPTPIPLVIAAADLPPTPTPTPTRLLTDQDLERFRNKILFLSDRSGQTQTWVLDPATGEVTGLVTEARIHQQAREAYLTGAPDGMKRAIVRPDSRENMQIMIEDMEFGTIHQVTHFDFATSYDPAWSPQWGQIAFVSTESGGDEIYVVNPEGDTPQRLTFNTWEWDKHPTWSPDGRQIVFFSNREIGRNQLWIMNADGSGQRNLSNSDFNDWDPVWVR
jgi:hypothetical protein